MLPKRRYAFSLVELLVVVAIIGLLIGFLLPAVQASREAARRLACASNLHQHALALSSYHAAHTRLPPGCLYGDDMNAENRLDYSWAALALGNLDQPAIYSAIDFGIPWHAAKNRAATAATLPVFRCAASDIQLPGATDYAGVSGSLMDTTPADNMDDPDVFERGVLVHAWHAREAITFGQITDGLSYTLAVAENSDFAAADEEDVNLWASGVNLISHDKGPVNSERIGVMSWHPGGAQAARADGSVRFIADTVEPRIVGALCTRGAGDETD